jgi:heptosyltransferase II
MRYQNSPKPSRIVVRGPNFLGDCVMARGFFGQLRMQFPDSHIVFVGLPVSSHFAQVGGWFDAVWTLEDKKPMSLLKMAGKIRREKFDLAISLPASVSAAALFFLSGVARRVGWAEPAARWMYHTSHLWQGPKSGQHKSDLYRQMLEWLDYSSEVASQPTVGEPTRQAKEWAIGSLATAFPSQNVPQANDYFVFAPGASIALRQWPNARRFLELLQQRFPTTPILLVGAPADAALGAALVASELPGVENWIGKTNLQQLIALCHYSKAVIAMDSGVAHTAASVAGAKTVVVFGPGDPRYVAPVGHKVAVARLPGLACSPCESAVCRGAYGHQACLKTLEPQAVLDAVEQLVLS